MGLFSSKKKTVVGTVVQRVIQDASLPNAVKTGVVKSIFESGDAPEYVMEELVSSVGLRAERMYEYARTSYTHGLPSGQIKSAMEGRTEVAAVLAALEGAPVLLDYSHYAPPNLLHIGWLKLVSEHGYSPITNQLAALSAVKGFTVYLNDMQVVVPVLADYEAGALEQWGSPAKHGYTPLRQFNALVGELRAATPVLVNAAAAEAYIRVDCIWLGAANATFTESFNISLTGYAEEADYFHAKYSVGGVTKYWMYQDNLGTHPALDAVFATSGTVNGTFFPFSYFRYNKISEIANKTTAAYLTSKKLVKYLGMDYDTIASAIDENPDIANVQQAMLVMAVPANTSHPLEQRYLFSFFDNLFYADANQFASQLQAGIAATLGAGPDISRSSLIIQDARFKMALSNGGITKKRVGGSIGAVGSHASGTGQYMVAQEYVGEFSLSTEIQYIPVKYHYYRRQVSHALYDEIQVANLTMLYYVLENYTTTGDELDDILLIPIDRSISRTYSIPDREVLYARSLHYVFNSVQIITIKWYQQAWFQFVMIVAAIVITVWTMGADGGALMTAIASGSGAAIAAAAWPILLSLLQGLVIGAVFKIIAKAVGAEFAILVAIVAAAYGGWQALQAGSIAGAPWAQQLLQISSGLAKAASANVQDQMGDLLDEYQSFNLFKDEATKQLEAANKLLEHNSFLSPLVIFGESPNDFYNRTAHSGNIGISGISAISSYVDIALTLPKLDETIG